MSDWKLRCAICWRFESDSLVTMQEHAMRKHGYAHEDFQHQERREKDGGYVWSFEVDGRDWLDATRLE